MLVVILGAGASYDSVPSLPARGAKLEARLPLADELFDNRPAFVGTMNLFYECLPVVPNLQHLAQGMTVELELERLQRESESNPRRLVQLAAIRFYLQVMIYQCQQWWMRDFARGRTNQTTMLDRIDHWRMRSNERVCLITFNYDTILEDAVSSIHIPIESLGDYIKNEYYKLIKLHGSTNWVRPVMQRPQFSFANLDQIGVANKLIEYAKDLRLGPIDKVIPVVPTSYDDGALFFPAIAIPVRDKSGEYECPHEHVDAMIDCLSQATKLVIIGWRGQETRFLKLLKEKLPKGLPTKVVSGNPSIAANTIKDLKDAGIDEDFSWFDGGFTEFILNRGIDNFLG